jgi:hypothetical protein
MRKIRKLEIDDIEEKITGQKITELKGQSHEKVGEIRV